MVNLKSPVLMLLQGPLVVGRGLPHCGQPGCRSVSRTQAQPGAGARKGCWGGGPRHTVRYYINIGSFHNKNCRKTSKQSHQEHIQGITEGLCRSHLPAPAQRIGQLQVSCKEAPATVKLKDSRKIKEGGRNQCCKNKPFIK